MSGSVVASLATLFGQHELSDCTVLFYRNIGSGDNSASYEPQGAAKRTRGSKRPATDPPADSRCGTRRRNVLVPVASSDPATVPEPSARTEPSLLPTGCVALDEPLPAHSLVLCCGSPRFRAQFERWSGAQQPPAQAAARVLRVPLDTDDDLPYARAAIKYMYDGTLEADAARGPAALLRVRRQAAYLQVEGCVEACDNALLDRVAALEGSKPLAGVVEVYGIRELLTSPDADPQLYARVLEACRQQLAASLSCARAQQAAVLPPGGPDLGELQAWAFGYVPSLLSHAESVWQMRSLAAFAMEALLGCDSLATDDEATVLLMAMTWLEGNDVDLAARQRLLRRLRLCQLNDTYLLRLLPRMPSWVISPQELRFLQQYAFASDGRRARIREEAEYKYDMSCGWYNTEPRRAPATFKCRRSYEWSADATKLKAVVGSPEPKYLGLKGMFTTAGHTGKVVVNGFEWHPVIEVIPESMEDVGLHLRCSIPRCLGVDEEDPVWTEPVPCRVTLYQWGCGEASGEEAWSERFEADELVVIGLAYGWPHAISLAARPSDGQEPAGVSSGAQRLQRLEPYVRDGKIWGSLTWPAP